MCIYVQMYAAILKFRTIHSRSIRILTAIVDLDLYELLGVDHMIRILKHY